MVEYRANSQQKWSIEWIGASPNIQHVQAFVYAINKNFIGGLLKPCNRQAMMTA